GANVVKTVIMIDLLVSMGVWSHHLLADTAQPMWMRVLSGQIITWGEYFTMGLTIFVSLMTIWEARPVRFTPPLKFAVASMFGFVMGGIAGLIQANVGLNMIFHNTQWVVALHAHTFLLTGVGTMLFSVLYTLVPMLTKLEFKSKFLVNAHLWCWMIGSVVMAYAMGMAGSNGMLRRTIYTNSEFSPYTLVGLFGGLLAGLGLILFLVNLISTIGVRNVLALVIPDRGPRTQPAETAA
ncbi:MAG: cbb3-type cytochrome c oxidase subunit I, partial [Anaerolineaceae bacterium]